MLNNASKYLFSQESWGCVFVWPDLAYHHNLIITRHSTQILQLPALGGHNIHSAGSGLSGPIVTRKWPYYPVCRGFSHFALRIANMAKMTTTATAWDRDITRYCDLAIISTLWCEQNRYCRDSGVMKMCTLPTVNSVINLLHSIICCTHHPAILQVC